jgi:4-hydroxybenzoate polyprenyltransferase
LLSAVGLIGAAYLINRVCFYLSPVALVVVCFYSLTKRFTDFTHVFLGAALALAPLGAWLAVTGNFELLPVRDGSLSLRHSALLALLLALAVVFWLIGFDLIYALQDYEFDRRQGLHSLVVRWGVDNALRASFLSHFIMWMVLALFGILARFWVAYLAGMLVIAFCLALEHWLARKRSLKWINIAFFRLNALISAVFVVVTIAEVAFPRIRLFLR